MGTPLDTANFAVRISTLSAALRTKVCAERILMNTVMSRPSPQTETFLMSSASLDIFSSGWIAPVMESPITVPQTGDRNTTASCEKNCAAPSVTVFTAAAVAAFPITAITPAYIGTNTSMNSEAAWSMFSVWVSASDTAAAVIPAPARTPTAENTPDMLAEPSPKLFARVHSRTIPHSAASSRTGSVRRSRHCSHSQPRTPCGSREAAPLLSGVIPAPSSISDASGGTASAISSAYPSAVIPHSDTTASVISRSFTASFNSRRILRPFQFS